MSELRDFVEFVQEWHADKIDQLEAIANAEASVSIVLEHPEGAPTVLTAEQSKWFRSGVIVALEQFKKLPFTVSFGDE